MTKSIFLLVMMITTLNCLSQSINNVKTIYSKTLNGQLGSETLVFNINGSEISIYDDYYKSKFTYGPIFLSETGYNEEGLFVESYKPNIKSDPLTFARGKEVIVYNIVYDTKGGTILFISQAKSINNKLNIKIYYTQEGYNKIK